MHRENGAKSRKEIYLYTTQPHQQHNDRYHQIAGLLSRHALNSNHSLYRLTSSSKFLERRCAVVDLRTSKQPLALAKTLMKYNISRCHELVGRLLQGKALRNEPHSLGQANPIRKHTIAVQPKTKVKIASFDQDSVEVFAGVGS
jgi:hypothetical protein